MKFIKYFIIVLFFSFFNFNFVLANPPIPDFDNLGDLPIGNYEDVVINQESINLNIDRQVFDNNQEIINIENISNSLIVENNQQLSSGGNSFTNNLNVNLIIKEGENVIFSGEVVLPKEETYIGFEGQNINAKSVLGVIYNLDIINDDFNISDLQYYSWGGFYLNCININNVNKCGNWQYVVDGSYPNLGMSDFVLNGGENIYLFFGNPYRLILNSNNLSINDNLIVKTEKYDPENNSWILRTGVTVGLTQNNPENPFSPIEFQTKQVDENAEAVFGQIAIGSYNVGVKEDYYWPSEMLNVSQLGCTSCGSSSGNLNFSLDSAFSFLKNNQNPDGSFDSRLYTDWVSIISPLSNDSSFKNSLKSYLLDDNFNSSLITDYERRAMALMSLGINPYNGTNVNYIEKIIDSFDGEQIGDSDLVNDDIFALIVLKNAGYDRNDEIINKIADFIVKKQSNNGSVSNIDLTSASILALENFEDLSVDQFLSKAKNYLKNIQNLDGSFGNVFSTSWAIQALSLDNNYTEELDMAKNYLANNQDQDGGLLKEENINNRIWATAYAIPAILGEGWNGIMSSFDKISNNETIEEVPVITPESITEIQNVEILPVGELIDIKKEIKKEVLESKNENIETLNQEKIEENNLPTENYLGASVFDSKASKNTPRWLIQSIIGIIGLGIFTTAFRLKI